MAGQQLNVLFIMVDQMRADCLSCAGHPVVRTPNLDALAAQGVRFRNTFVQSAICGPSRMCIYTGRYPHATRAPWNEVPLPAEERTVGHYFLEAGYRAALCGKSHYVADPFALPPADPGRERIEYRTLAGLEAWELKDGAKGEGWLAYLRKKGYPEEVIRSPYQVVMPENPGGTDPSAFPIAIRAEDHDTAYLTDRAMQFMEEAEDQLWMLHLSYFRPHHPLAAPAPYHALYDPAHMPAPNRCSSELADPHPLHIPYRVERKGTEYDEEGVWRQRRATYYALITEIDDHLGRLFGWMQARGLWKNTLICFVSDHGVYLGDHWTYQKELFYDEAYQVPLILFDPRPEADARRGAAEEAFVESIDLLPTLLEAAGVPVAPAIQGRSLVPFLQGDGPSDWRTEVYADWDFRFYWTPKKLGLPPEKCRGWMVRDRDFKLWHFNGLPDVLFDLREDPLERHNRAADPAYREVVQRYLLKLIDWRMSCEDVSRVAWTYERRPNFGPNPFAGEG